MRRRTSGIDEINIGAIALPLLVCLMGAVVGLGAALPTEACGCAEDQASKALLRLIGRADGLRQDVEEPLLQRVGFDRNRQELTRSHEEIAEVKKTIDLGQQVATVEKRVAAIEQVPAPKPASGPSPDNGVLGSYTGPYVLLDCRAGAATVYPGGRKIASNPTDADFKTMMATIRQAGFVAIAVRPSGWFKDSFDHLSVRIFKELGDHSPVRHLTFPLKEADPIEPFLPRSAG